MAFTYSTGWRARARERDNNTPIVSHFLVNLFAIDPFPAARERFEKLIYFHPSTRENERNGTDGIRLCLTAHLGVRACVVVVAVVIA